MKGVLTLESAKIQNISIKFPDSLDSSVVHQSLLLPLLSVTTNMLYFTKISWHFVNGTLLETVFLFSFSILIYLL